MINARSQCYCGVVWFLVGIFLWGVERKRKNAIEWSSFHSGEIEVVKKAGE